MDRVSFEISKKGRESLEGCRLGCRMDALGEGSEPRMIVDGECIDRFIPLTANDNGAGSEGDGAG